MTCNADDEVLGVFTLTLTLTHFLPKTIFFQRIWGMYIKLVEIPEGWGGGGLFLCSKNGNSGEEGGPCVKFPPWWGYGYFLKLHNTAYPG